MNMLIYLWMDIGYIRYRESTAYFLCLQWELFISLKFLFMSIHLTLPQQCIDFSKERNGGKKSSSEHG